MTPQPLTRRAAAEQMLIDAAALCGWCENYWRDENAYLYEGVQIYYAVDADVVNMYVAPRRMLGHGRVFSQADDISESTSELIGEFILQRFGRGPSSPSDDSGIPAAQLILLPPHDAEVKSVALAISDKVAQLTRAESARAEELHNALSARLQGVPAENISSVGLSFLEEQAPEVLNLLLGMSGPSAQFLALKGLPKKRIVKLHDHPAFRGDQRLTTPPAREQLVADINEWYLLMIATEGGLSGRKLSKVVDDAYALAAVDWINRDATLRGINKRLVLVTGTARILSAGTKREPYHKGFATFADAYLRHPRGFMGAKNFFSPHKGRKRDTEFRVLEWLAVLFPNAIRQTRTVVQSATNPASTVEIEAVTPDVNEIRSGKALNSALNYLLSEGYRQLQNDVFPDNALSEWREVIRQTHLQIFLQRNKARTRALNRLLKMFRGSGANRVETLLDRLSRLREAAFTKLYLTTGVIGVEQLLDKRSNMRGVPALRFDMPDYSGAQEQFDVLASKLFDKEKRPEHFNVEEMYRKLRTEDDSNYHAHVLHAFIYASAGRWFSARTLCRVALLAVDAIPAESAGRRTGREAAYLMAVAERRLASDANKLQLSIESLKQARDRARGEEKNDLRFASEELAHTVTRKQIAFFHGQVPRDLDPTTDLNKAKELCYLAMTREVRAVRRWVIRQAVTNGLLSALVAIDAGRRHSPQTIGIARELIEVLDEERLAPELGSSRMARQLYPDETSDFVWLVSVVMFDRDLRPSEARTVLSTREFFMQQESLLPFEKIRLQRFLKLAGVQ